MGNPSYKLIDNVSSVYRHLLPDFFNRSFPYENLTTCDNCVLLDNGLADAFDVQGSIHEYCIFHPDVKCCTYEPDVPNFLVGAILSSNNPELVDGQKRIIQKIKQAKGVTPQNIKATKSSSSEYSQLIDQNPGCYEDIGCPYFDKSSMNCSIWMFRQANCSSFFCKSREGIAGQLFWESMNYYLTQIEKELARIVVKTLDFSGEEELWRRDKAKYYIAAYRAAQKLSRDDFEKASSSSLSDYLDQVKKRYSEAICTTVPDKLKRNPVLKHEKFSDSKYQYDTGQGRCFLSQRLHSILGYFDGNKSNEEVVRLIDQEQDIQVPSRMLTRLFKNRILISVTDPEC